MDEYFAHTREDAPQEQWQLLIDHLSAVAERSASFASDFGAGEWARVLGMVHDVGKGSEAFQERLRGKPIQVDHATAGAQLLAKLYGVVGKQLAYAVAGHHGGIPNGATHSSGSGGRSPLKARLEKQVEPYESFAETLELPSFEALRSEMPTPLQNVYAHDPKEHTFDLTFLVRMLYSCLVDADFLDTEQFVEPKRAASRGKKTLTLEEMKSQLDSKMASFEKDGSPVNAARSDIHKVCLRAAFGKPGIYSLTIPTGSGKTLDSLDFALTHAIANGQRRIIYAIPFTSVVEQTAHTFKSMFGVESVLEHHSNYDYKDLDGDERAAVRQRLSMENWDAPLIVTTNVQLFESVYSDKPSRCRKNHNLAKSVIILDEVQSLPDEYLKPCLAALEELSRNYGTTVILCTATQPALDAVWPFGTVPTEIVPISQRHQELFEHRVKIEHVGELSIQDLVDKLVEEDQVLCIVSTRGAASRMYDEVAEVVGPDGVFHLSASMTPNHRGKVLAEVEGRLKDGLPCKVISTQLIEAGVDIDFPTVFREVAGIDSIKQAAGRCNREGKRDVGHVYVFECNDFAVVDRGWLARMRALGLEVIQTNPHPFADDGVRQFFEARYGGSGSSEGVEDTDCLNIMSDFSESQYLDGVGFPYESCGEDFRFIKDEQTTLFIPWGDEAQELLAAIRSGEVDISQSRKIQSYCIGVRSYAVRKLEAASAVTSYPPYLVLEPREGALPNYSVEKGFQMEEMSEFLAV